MIGRNSRGEGILRMDDPMGQIEAAHTVAVLAPERRQEFGRSPPNLLAAVLVITADMNVGLPRFGILT